MWAFPECPRCPWRRRSPTGRTSRGVQYTSTQPFSSPQSPGPAVVPAMQAGTCPSKADLSAFHRGQLPDPDLDTLAAHLESCTHCSALLDRIEEEGDPFTDPLRQLGSDL